MRSEWERRTNYHSISAKFRIFDFKIHHAVGLLIWSPYVTLYPHFKNKHSRWNEACYQFTDGVSMKTRTAGGRLLIQQATSHYLNQNRVSLSSMTPSMHAMHPTLGPSESTSLFVCHMTQLYAFILLLPYHISWVSVFKVVAIVNVVLDCCNDRGSSEVISVRRELPGEEEIVAAVVECLKVLLLVVRGTLIR